MVIKTAHNPTLEPTRKLAAQLPVIFRTSDFFQGFKYTMEVEFFLTKIHE